MDRHKVKEAVREWLPKIRWLLQLQDWTINVTYDGTDWGRATCRPTPGYQVAEIELEPAKIRDLEQLKNDLWHECLHILDAEMENFRKACFQHVDSTKAEYALDVIFKNAKESTASRIERVFLHGLGLDLDRALSLSERYVQDCSGDKACFDHLKSVAGNQETEDTVP